MRKPASGMWEFFKSNCNGGIAPGARHSCMHCCICHLPLWVQRHRQEEALWWLATALKNGVQRGGEVLCVCFEGVKGGVGVQLLLRSSHPSYPPYTAFAYSLAHSTAHPGSTCT